MNPVRGAMLIGLGLLCWTIATGPAAALDAPKGRVILTITGAISETNSPNGLALDQQAIDALPHTVVKTETPWTQGMVEFSGVALKDILALAGAKGQTIHAVALNDYTVEIPFADAENPQIIVADRKNGEAMPIRDKGPLWVIYPLSDQPNLKTEATHAKMIWQLARLEIE